MNTSCNISPDAVLWSGWMLAKHSQTKPSFGDAVIQPMATSEPIQPGNIERDLETLYPLIYRFVSGMTWGSGLDAEDITQDVFLKAYKNASRFQNDSTLSTWMYKIARNTVIDALRRRKFRQAFTAFWPLNEDNDPAEVPGNESLSDEMDATEMQNIVRKAIAELNEPYRSLIIWRELEELPYKMISEITGDSEGTLKSRVFYAKKKLREILITKGIDYETN